MAENFATTDAREMDAAKRGADLATPCTARLTAMDEYPRGSNFERDFERSKAVDLAAMLETSSGPDRADLFDTAIVEDGATWPAFGKVCAAVYGITVLGDCLGSLPGKWLAQAVHVLDMTASE